MRRKTMAKSTMIANATRPRPGREFLLATRLDDEWAERVFDAVWIVPCYSLECLVDLCAISERNYYHSFDSAVNIRKLPFPNIGK